MTIKPFYKALAALMVSGMMFGANANNISFDQAQYTVNPGDAVQVTVTYDFTDFAMFGGGFNLIYDASTLTFVDYARTDFDVMGADLPPQNAASPTGGLDSAGNYLGAGIGTFDFFNGLLASGVIGVFTFIYDGPPTEGGFGTPCGSQLCLMPNVPQNPMVSLAGGDVTADIFGDPNAIYAANVPVPAAVWFLLSGLGALLGFGRKKA